jgi:membrane associated rhomboid family serine protease
MTPGSAWLRLCAGLALSSIAVTAIALGGDSNPALHLAWQASTWAQAPWTWWTASLVHLSWTHLGANLLGLGAVAVLGYAVGANRFAFAALMLAWPLSNLGLAWGQQLWPEVSNCSGLSGLLHAATAILWSFVAINFAPTRFSRFISWMLFGGVTLKLMLEQPWSHPVVFDPSFGFEVVQASHWVGTLMGAACGASLALANLLHQRRGGVTVHKG